MDMLLRYTTGEAHDLIKDCILLETSEEAYDQAMALLTKDYGHPATLAASYNETAQNWPRIVNGDKEGMTWVMGADEEDNKIYKKFLSYCEERR